MKLPNGEVEIQKCYGVITQFYVHFMYPPSLRHCDFKLTTKQLLDLQTPWILCADCEWYEELGVCSTTGLVRVQPNLHWQQCCSLHNMANTFPVNVSYWPEVPFDPDHFNDKGEPKQNIKNGCYDFSGLTSVLNVINM